MALDTSPWQLPGKRLERVLEGLSPVEGESPWRRARTRLRRDPAATWSLRFLVVVAVLSLLAPLLPLPSPSALQLSSLPQPPVWPWEAFAGEPFEPSYWELSPIDQSLVDLRIHLFSEFQFGPWLGTDDKGRDILARIVWGSRTSLLVALAATLCSLLIGVTYGALAGFAGGRVDNLMMRAVDVLYSLPFIFLVIFILTILNTPREELAGEPLLDRERVFFVVIGAVYWLTMARVVRGQVLALKNAEFVQAARCLGASPARIIFRHLVPNLLSVVVVYLTLTIPAVLLFEAFLSFLGLGVQPPKVSWGLLAVEGIEAINPIRSFWWLVLWPSLALGGTLLALNLLGDGLRDALDPKGASRSARGGGG